MQTQGDKSYSYSRLSDRGHKPCTLQPAFHSDRLVAVDRKFLTYVCDSDFKTYIIFLLSHFMHISHEGTRPA